LCLSAVLLGGIATTSLRYLYGQGFGEFEAEGGLSGQDDLLAPGVCRSCGSRTGTHCGTNQGSFTTAGKPPDVGEDLESGIMPTDFRIVAGKASVCKAQYAVSNRLDDL
jgi:hypothetical protein